MNVVALRRLCRRKKKREKKISLFVYVVSCLFFSSLKHHTYCLKGNITPSDTDHAGTPPPCGCACKWIEFQGVKSVITIANYNWTTSYAHGSQEFDFNLRENIIMLRGSSHTSAFSSISAIARAERPGSATYRGEAVTRVVYLRKHSPDSNRHAIAFHFEGEA